MTKFPQELNDINDTRNETIKIRDLALSQLDFNSAVVLSHAIAWLYWLKENEKELREL